MGDPDMRAKFPPERLTLQPDWYILVSLGEVEMKKKTYSKPVIKSEPIKVGVFGNYGKNPNPTSLGPITPPACQ